MLHWRVIAQRRNGQQRIIDERVSRDTAEKLRDTLRALSLFPLVYVEIDEESVAPRQHDAAGSLQLS